VENIVILPLLPVYFFIRNIRRKDAGHEKRIMTQLLILYLPEKRMHRRAILCNHRVKTAGGAQGNRQQCITEIFFQVTERRSKIKRIIKEQNSGKQCFYVDEH